MEKRQLISVRMKPEVIKKLDCVVDQLNIDTSFWGQNKHTRQLGYWRKKVSRADVLEIIVKKAFDEIQETR